MTEAEYTTQLTPMERRGRRAFGLKWYENEDTAPADADLLALHETALERYDPYAIPLGEPVATVYLDAEGNVLEDETRWTDPSEAPTRHGYETAEKTEESDT